MPTKRIGGFLCYFVSYDCIEPPHIHLAKGKVRTSPSAKFWLEPVHWHTTVVLTQANCVMHSESSLKTNASFWRCGMNTVTIDAQPRVREVEFVDDKLSVSIEDGRVVLVPLTWYPRLLHATAEERNDWRVFEDSDGRDIIFWEQLDELIPVIALIVGVPSRESERSFAHWLDSRQ